MASSAARPKKTQRFVSLGLYNVLILVIFEDVPEDNEWVLIFYVLDVQLFICCSYFVSDPSPLLLVPAADDDFSVFYFSYSVNTDAVLLSLYGSSEFTQHVLPGIIYIFRGDHNRVQYRLRPRFCLARAATAA